MREPDPRTSRLAIAAGLVVAIALAGVGFLAGRSSIPPATAPVPLPAPTLDVPPAPEPVAAPVALDRGALLTTLVRAADAFSSGLPFKAANEVAPGQRFDLVLPFGCAPAGATQSDGTMRWRFDPKRSTLRVTIDPAAWTEVDWPSLAPPDSLAPTGTKAIVRGFWIARPWSSATTCVADREAQDQTSDQPLTPSPETFAIGRLMQAEKPGTNRPYEVVQRATAADFDPELGFRLRILGRIEATPGGPFIHCVQAGSEQAPKCLATAAFAEIRLENAKTGNVLGSWPIGDDVRGTEATRNAPPKAEGLR